MKMNGNEKTFTPFPQTANPREAAYLALLASVRSERYIDETMALWKQLGKPSQSDYHLAERIACGTMQMATALDFLANRLADKKKLSLKLKERILLRLSLYQYYFLERIPLYALANESVTLAKKYCHRTFAEFLNAVLRRLPNEPFSLPSRETIEDFSICYSYPDFFIKQLSAAYGLSQTREILIAGNQAAPIIGRLRANLQDMPQHWLKGIDLIGPTHIRTAVLKDLQLLPEISASPLFYIQNITPAFLIAELAQGCSNTPRKILDLCAAPGGKLLAVHDAFPPADLFANDVTPKKMQKLEENCSKYGLKPHFSCGRGENFSSSDLFDIIIIDAPCSNSGVLNKRPEARWRISQEALNELQETQLRLLAHASAFLSPKGEVWYMTCSILKQENEVVVERACAQHHLHIRYQKSVLPSLDGWDGGFACALRK